MHDTIRDQSGFMASHHVTTQSRRDALAKLAAMRVIDVLIVGAGVNGAGSFRELCINGVNCVIVDREDFGAGATNASTRIAHGGLRYLETGQLRLVAEATLERNRLLQNAPHYVKPLLITIPSFSRFGGVLASVGKMVGKVWPMNTRGVVLVKIGLVIYDWLGRKQRSLPLHRIDGRRNALTILPDLNPDIAGICSYYDARITHTERLTFELIQAGLDANPASLAINHVALKGFHDGAVLLRDECEGIDLTIRPRVLVNAGGAWIDDVNDLMGQADHLIGGTKGSHIMVRNETLRHAMDGRAFSFDDGGGRMCVAYEAFGLVMLGTSDIRVDHADDATCSEDEIAYFLDKIRIVFPKIEVRRDEVKYAFVGVRPLPQATAGATVNISRDHSFKWHEPKPDRPFPILSLIGGKWTTGGADKNLDWVKP
jgi:glycerol-3-phosphate dehydrogenase